jgi:hypothetical protein
MTGNVSHIIHFYDQLEIHSRTPFVCKVTNVEDKILRVRDDEYPSPPITPLNPHTSIQYSSNKANDRDGSVMYEQEISNYGCVLSDPSCVFNSGSDHGNDISVLCQ